MVGNAKHTVTGVVYLAQFVKRHYKLANLEQFIHIAHWGSGIESVGAIAFENMRKRMHLILSLLLAMRKDKL